MSPSPERWNSGSGPPNQKKPEASPKPWVQVLPLLLCGLAECGPGARPAPSTGEFQFSGGWWRGGVWGTCPKVSSNVASVLALALGAVRQLNISYMVTAGHGGPATSAKSCSPVGFARCPRMASMEPGLLI